MASPDMVERRQRIFNACFLLEDIGDTGLEIASGFGTGFRKQLLEPRSAPEGQAGVREASRDITVSRYARGAYRQGVSSDIDDEECRGGRWQLGAITASQAYQSETLDFLLRTSVKE